MVGKPHLGDIGIMGITLLFHSRCVRCINFRVISNRVRTSESFISMDPASVRPAGVLHFQVENAVQEKRKFIKTNTLPRSNNQNWLHCPYMVSTLQTSSLEPKDKWHWGWVCTIRDQVWFLMYLYVKNSLLKQSYQT